jgi:hypothetical protein
MGEPLSSYIEEPTRPTAVVSTMNSQSVSYVAAPPRAHHTDTPSQSYREASW